MNKSLFGRVQLRFCFGKGSAWEAGQEPEPFFACAGEA